MQVLRKRKQLERDLEARCVRVAKARGFASRKMNGLGFAAWPDRLFLPPKTAWPWLAGKRFWVEFKREGEDPTRLQAHLHDDLRARGETVFVIDNARDFDAALDRCAPTRAKKISSG